MKLFKGMAIVWFSLIVNHLNVGLAGVSAPVEAITLAPSPVELYSFEGGQSDLPPVAMTPLSVDSKKEGWVAPAGTGLAIGNGRLLITVSEAGVGCYAYRGEVPEYLSFIRSGAGAESKEAAARIEIRQSTSGKAVVQVEWTGKAARKLMLSLKRGSLMAEVKACGEQDCLEVETGSQHWVVPGFVGDDYARSAVDFKSGDKLFIPAERVLLGLGQGGTAMLFLAWPAGEPVLSTRVGGDGQFSRLAIQNEGKSIFMGGLIQAGLWRECDTSASKVGEATSVAGPLPFGAKWQATLIGPDAVSTWDLRQGDAGFKCGPHGFQVTVPWPFRAAKGGGGESMVLVTPPEAVHRGIIRRALIYPLRRNEKTPLNMFLPEDLLTEVFNTGVCEYVQHREWSGAGQGGPLCVLGARLGKLNAIYAGHGRVTQYWLQNIDWRLQQGLSQYQRLRDYRTFAVESRNLCQALRFENQREAVKLQSQILADCDAIIESCDAALKMAMAPARDWRDVAPGPEDTPEQAMRKIAEECKEAMRATDADAAARIEDLSGKLSFLATAPQTELPRPRRLTQSVQNTAGALASASSEAAQTASKIRGLGAKVLTDKHWAEEGR